MSEPAGPTLIVVSGPPGSGKTRIEDRLRTTGSRAAHDDRGLLRRMDAGAATWEPVSLPVPALTVDTTAGYSPALGDIVAFAS